MVNSKEGSKKDEYETEIHKEGIMKDEMDILKEVASVASAHGSSALSEILGRKITLKLPSISSIDSDSLLESKEANKLVLSVQCKILTGIEGKILFVLEDKSAYKLITLCYKDRKKDETSGFLTEVGMSVIKEVGNIVIGSYVGALSMLLKALIVSSLPALVSAPLYEVLNSAISFKEREYAILISAIFEEEHEEIRGKMYLILTEYGIKKIQEACKKVLDSLGK